MFNLLVVCYWSVVLWDFLLFLGRLNWWCDVSACRKLFPLSTVGDGNCLLHAVSLGMWGFHDRLLILRRSLYKTLQHPLAKNGLKRRWKYDLWKENIKTGLLWLHTFFSFISFQWCAFLPFLFYSQNFYYLPLRIYISWQSTLTIMKY